MRGPARDALEVAVARALAVMRVFGLGLQFAVIGVWHRWYLTPAHLAVPAVAAGWGVVFIIRCLRGGLDRVTAAGELAVTTLLLATASWSLPPKVAFGAPNWVMLRLGGASTAIGWCVPLGLWLGATAVLAAAGVTGALAVGGSPGTVAIMVSTEVAAGALFTAASTVLRRGATEADEALVQAGARQREQAVAAARLQAQREAERVLHDTVLNTLVGLAWGAPGSSGELIRARCRHSVDECADMLGIRGDLDAARDVAARLAEVVTQARHDGLDVGLASGDRADVPPEVGAAVAAAVAEALSNVRRHAGVSRADVVLHARDSGIRVVVRDAGKGFEPRSAPADRLGVRYSIMDRMADVGGSAAVESTRGQGTTVTVRWSRDRTSPPSLGTETAMLERSYALDTAAAAGVGALLWQVGLGALVLSRFGDYRDPPIVLGAWAVGLAAIAWCAAAVGRGRLAALPYAALPYAGWLVGRTADAARRRAESFLSPVTADGQLAPRAVGLLTVVLVGEQLAAGLTGRAGAAPPQNWVLLACVSIIIFLLGCLRPRVWLPVTLLMVGTGLAVILSRADLPPGVANRVATLVYTEIVLVTAVAVLLRARRVAAGVTAEAARAEADLTAERLTALAIRRDRYERLRRLADGPLRLLADVGAGRLDPHDGAVQRRSAASADALRRTLIRQLTPPTTLAAALEPAVADAERRGVGVEVQIAGAVDNLPGPTRDEVVATVASALAGVAGGRAVITVVGDTREGSVFLAYDVPEPGIPWPRAAPAGPGGAARRWTELVEDADDGRAYVEVRWGAARVGQPDA